MVVGAMYGPVMGFEGLWGSQRVEWESGKLFLATAHLSRLNHSFFILPSSSLRIVGQVWDENGTFREPLHYFLCQVLLNKSLCRNSVMVSCQVPRLVFKRLVYNVIELVYKYKFSNSSGTLLRYNIFLMEKLRMKILISKFGT